MFVDEFPDAEAANEEVQPKPALPKAAPKRHARPEQAGHGGVEFSPWAHPLSVAHFGAQQSMFDATNKAISDEMDWRRLGAENERNRQHEYQMEQLRQQQQAAPPPAYHQPAPPPPDQAYQQARNRQLMGMAGFGGHTVTSGPDGVQVIPHGFFGPMARSLLG